MFQTTNRLIIQLIIGIFESPWCLDTKLVECIHYMLTYMLNIRTIEFGHNISEPCSPFKTWHRSGLVKLDSCPKWRPHFPRFSARGGITRLCLGLPWHVEILDFRHVCGINCSCVPPQQWGVLSICTLYQHSLTEIEVYFPTGNSSWHTILINPLEFGVSHVQKNYYQNDPNASKYATCGCCI